MITELSKRELDVLREISRGLTNPMIAFNLCVGHETIKTYIKRIRSKLGIKSRIGLILYFERNYKNKETA